MAVIPLERAVELVSSLVQPLPSEPLELARARGSVLAEDLVATVDTPPFDASAMDGYALRSEDVATAPTELRVVATSSSGHPTAVSVDAGTAVRILTGAVVPEGADAVVPVEATDAGLDVVTVSAVPTPGQHIRRRGEVGRSGELLVAASTLLTAGHLGVAASTGRTELRVHRRPRVAIVTTGDELVAPGDGELGPGQIFDSNSTLAEQLVRSADGRTEVVHAEDDAAALGALLERLAPEVDLILTTGGISMGAEFDPLRAALEEHPVRFEQVAIRPAKPLAFGTIGSAAYVGLPGNPVSVVVAFELFVRPLLSRLRGLGPVGTPRSGGVLADGFSLPGDAKTHLVPIVERVDGTWSRNEMAGSHALVAIASADALAVVPAEIRSVAAGATVEILPLWT